MAYRLIAILKYFKSGPSVGHIQIQRTLIKIEEFKEELFEDQSKVGFFLNLFW